MSFGISLEVFGDLALFSRPEMKVERVSYDVITPSAARGVLEAIYWKPEIRWVIDELHVLNPIAFTNIRRNEIASKIAPRSVSKAMKIGRGKLFLDINEKRQQRASLLLRDVRYVIKAHFEETESSAGSAAKHIEMFKRRAKKGQYFHHPYLGCREFPAYFRLVDAAEIPKPHTALMGKKDLGFMLHDIIFDQDVASKKVNDTTPLFFRAIMNDGVISVPPLHSCVGGSMRNP